MKNIALLSSLALSCFLLACEQPTKEKSQSDSEIKTKTQSQKIMADTKDEPNKNNGDNFRDTYNNISLSDYKNHVKTLSSDEFSGREPATDGGRKTVAYIAEQFKQAGLLPGNNNGLEASYEQKVPLISIEADTKMSLTLGETKLSYFDEFVAGTSKPVKSISLKDSELVFVGYGVVAPEYNWNDYAGIDMKGKTAVILVNDPGFMTQDSKLFQGKTMTYYGRWTYKYEEAGRQGAAGAIIIHDTAPASYGWGVVSNSWSGAQYHLKDAGNDPKPDVEMWISNQQAQNLFKRAGLNLAEQQKKALSRDFKPVSLKQNASVEVNNVIKHSESSNVIATIPGTENPEEHVIYMAHWDHLGEKGHFEGDQIFNGAIDNATGVAGIISMAQAFNQLNVKPTRSITFMAITAEEQGLLGSKYFAANPTVATNNIVGAFNIDSMNVSGRVKDLTVIGFGKSELEEYVTRAAKYQQRTTKVEASPERGGYYRSDHFSLAKKGVPAIFAGGGSEYRDDVDMKKVKSWNKRKGKCYHQLCDEYQEDWDWTAALDDVKVLFEAGYMLSIDSKYPNWYQGTEFRALREQDLESKVNNLSKD